MPEPRYQAAAGAAGSNACPIAFFIPAAIVNMLEATLLFAVLAVQILTRYRLRRVMAPVPTPAEESVPAGAP